MATLYHISTLEEETIICECSSIFEAYQKALSFVTTMEQCDSNFFHKVGRIGKDFTLTLCRKGTGGKARKVMCWSTLTYLERVRAFLLRNDFACDITDEKIEQDKANIKARTEKEKQEMAEIAERCAAFDRGEITEEELYSK